MNCIVSIERIENSILFIRGQKVILDFILADLYEVETKNLNKAVKRNFERFPEDFVFQLSSEEFSRLRFQFGTSNQRGGRRYLPLAFTEQGVAMLSSVLKSKKAAQVNVQIMRTFVKIRQMLISHKTLSVKLEALEKKI